MELYSDTERAAASSSAPAARNGAHTGTGGAVGGQPGPALGIYAKTEAAFSRIDKSTGEVLDSVEDPKKHRAERFALKSVVNQLLPDSRTSKCCRWRVPSQRIEIRKSREHGSAFYTGLQVCASVWACPVCAAKISERRRAELVGALDVARSKGLSIRLLTLTVPHGLGDDLPTLLAQIRAAWRRTTTGRAGKAARKSLGIVGTVRALEVTHGQNGFHPHLHVLLFVEGGTGAGRIQGVFSPLWQDACVKSGLPRPSDEHGCRVDDGSHAAAYASKWGLESEMTKSHVKKGRSGSRSPWDFLRAVFDRSDGWQQSAHLFRTYAESFKGQRQLYWSNGLRSLLSLDAEASDAEIAAAHDDSASVLAELTADQWRAILRTRSECVVLDFAERSPLSLPTLLASLCAMASSKRPRSPPHS